MKRQVSLAVSFFLFALLFSPIQLLAAPYYEGKVLKIIVGYEAGGGYDRMARLLAKHLPKHIPGKPSIVVENMIGADSMMAANYGYSMAKPDGLTIIAFDRAMPFSQLLKIEGVKFNIAKYSWIGSAAVEPYVLVIRSDLPYKTFDELRKAKEPINLGTVGIVGADAQFCTYLKEFLGLNTNIVHYISSAAIMLAIERKEVEGRGGSYSSVKPYVDRGLVRPVIRRRASEPEVENLPVAEDLTNNKTHKTLLSICSIPDQIGRPYVAPPGTPDNIMRILREAFVKVAEDPELKEESKKLKMTVKYVPADECLNLVNFLLNQPEDIVKEIAKYMKP